MRTVVFAVTKTCVIDAPRVVNNGSGAMYMFQRTFIGQVIITWGLRLMKQKSFYFPYYRV